MFYFFLSDCRYSVYKDKIRANIFTMNWYQLLSLFSSVLLMLIGIYYMRFPTSTMNIPFTAFPIILIIIIMRIDDYICEKRSEEIYANYNYTIFSLIRKLKDWDNNLFNIRSIDWLIECCEDEINSGILFPPNSIKRFFETALCPLIILSATYIIKDLTTIQAIAIILLISFILIISFFFSNSISTTMHEFLLTNKAVAKRLRKDLKYIRSTMSEETHCQPQ